MNLKLFLLISLLSSCAITKVQEKLLKKGYDLSKDTISIKPYEYVILQKGYTPQYLELNPINKLNLKISIKGYENMDTIPLNVIYDNFKLTISDSSIKNLNSGEIRFKLRGISNVVRFKTKNIDNALFSFAYVKDRIRKVRDNAIILFWDVVIEKDNVLYNIPSRYYYIKQ